jgi:LPS-assembly protein
MLSENVRCKDITFVNADMTQYGKDFVRCSGRVVIVYGGRIISADVISCDLKKKFVTAEGNVIIKDERKNTYFLDSLSVGKNFASGEGRNLKIIMRDNSRLAAEKCILKNGVYELKNVIYTPCYNCTDFGELTWQVKASSASFDPEKYTEYSNARFELFGTPILYTPYMSHVSPKIKRKSGLLVPRFSTSSKSGIGFLPQYLWSISDSAELILKPIVTSKIGSVGWAFYGLRFPGGEFNVDASIAGVKSAKNRSINGEQENKVIRKIIDSGYRGHLFSKMRYEINNLWRCGFDINLASDRYYLKKFPFFADCDRTLKSDLRLEGFEGRNYTSVKTAVFQGENSDCIPRLLPMIERNYTRNLFSGTFDSDSYFVNLDFNKHRSAQKIVSNASWRKEALLPFGHLIGFKGILSFRGLRVSERVNSDYDSSFRIIPQLNLFWKWPLVLSSDFAGSAVFIPVCGLIAAPAKKVSDAFEDPFCEITDINFLSGNRSVSPYNLDYGNRICYGFKLSGYRKGENFYHFVAGRSVELTNVSYGSETADLKYKNSDIVFSADFFLSNKWTFISDCSYSPRSKRWRKIETRLNFSDQKFYFDLMLFKGKQCFYDPFSTANTLDNRKTQKYRGIMLNAGWQISGSVKIKGGLIIGNERDPVDDKQEGCCRLVRHDIGAEYKNECLTAELIAERKNFRGGDLKPETVFRFVLHLKNL